MPVTADRGLCGGFKSIIKRDTFKYVKSLENEGKKVKLITIGKKSRDFFSRLMKEKIIEKYADFGSSGADYNIALDISNNIQNIFFEGQFDICVLIYNQFKSAMTQTVTRQQIIPLDVSSNDSKKDESKISDKSIYIYEPDENEILKELLPKNVSTQIFKVLLESNAGEQGARMVAMDNATRNAGEMINNLTLKYNRTRQAFITKELIEIISGAESV